MLSRIRWSALPAVAALLVLAPASARGSGFAIFEQGARGMGFAGAFTAQASDPSAIFHNAAGVAFLKGNQFQLGGTLIAPSTDFTGTEPFPGSTITEQGDAGIVIPPALDFTHQFSDRLAAGIGLHVPFGLRTRWANPDSYSGRFISQKAELQVYSLNPTLAYKLADRLAVGFGVDVRFSTVNLERNVGSVDPFTQSVVDVAHVDLKSDTGTGVGFNVGLLAKPIESLSIGLAYRHKVKVDYGGNATFTRLSTGNAQFDAAVATQIPTGETPVASSIEFPAIFSGGIAFTAGNFTIEGDVNWYGWSSFKQLPLTFKEYSSLSGVIEEQYENAMQYRVGIEWRASATWAIRGGYFFDETPTPPASVGPMLPDADRHGIAVGLSWQRGNFSLDIANWYLLFKERSSEGLNRDNYNGIYQNSAELFSMTIGYRF